MSTHNIPLAQSKFMIVYTISLLLCFSPIKSISLVSPMLIIFLMIFFVSVRSVYNFNRFVQFLFLYIVLGVVYFLINEDFLWLNFFFCLLTFSPFLFLLLSFDAIVDRRLLKRMARATLLVLLLEASIGFVQVLYNALFITHGFDGGTGDAAMGTINPTLGQGDGAASNVYFAIGLSGLAVLALVSRRFEKNKGENLLFLFILGTWILASVMHSIFLLLSSVVITLTVLVFFMPKKRLSFLQKQLGAIRTILLASAVATVTLLLVLPDNVELLKTFYQRTFDPEKMESPKAIATLESFQNLNEDKPWQKYVGLGPGQYTSRASLILSDTYLNSKLPGFLRSVSPDLERNILPLWLSYKSASFQAGSTYFPFYSWLTAYTEWGLLGIALLFIFLFRIFRKLMKHFSPENFYLIIGLFIMIGYILLLGIQDNYWEWAQFILPFVIYCKVLYSLIINPSAEIVQENKRPNIGLATDQAA